MPSSPSRGWLVVAAGMAVNLCLGILYAWSVWKANLTTKVPDLVGTPMPTDGLNAGWTFLSDADATWAYAVCGLTFALFMIPGGRLQDRYGPRIGVTLGGLFLAAGCVLAGVLHSYLGLIVGFGILGGIGMGLGYAAATPAAVKWFGPHRRGLIVGLVVGGYGGAAIYIAPLATELIARYGITGSFVALGLSFAVVVVVAGRLLTPPPPGFVPAGPMVASANPVAVVNWAPREMLRTWQYFALVVLMFGGAQSGLLLIANAVPLLAKAAKGNEFFAQNGWLLAAFGGIVNALGRVGTGSYSDRIGRTNAYTLNGVASAACLFLMPTVIESNNVGLLFLVVGIAYWQYGGGLSLMPAMTADFYGPKNLGTNYGLVFLGWGLAFLVPLTAGYIKGFTGNDDAALYLSGGILTACVVLSRLVTRPIVAKELP
ncbi:L-lactate MFS transporter [Limnoglobus roseus]|uniref:MFS transporter n=1 Tax=Limnoglobus roseus TaxID=2598579 RepID=A0A5C1AB41_9BACT|nr:MFS transporter [Limnoglobus roseus]QEL15940.1 MFS transporter [Limnoglobus roseus]